MRLQSDSRRRKSKHCLEQYIARTSYRKRTILCYLYDRRESAKWSIILVILAAGSSVDFTPYADVHVIAPAKV